MIERWLLQAVPQKMDKLCTAESVAATLNGIVDLPFTGKHVFVSVKLALDCFRGICWEVVVGGRSGEPDELRTEVMALSVLLLVPQQ